MAKPLPKDQCGDAMRNTAKLNAEQMIKTNTTIHEKKDNQPKTMTIDSNAWGLEEPLEDHLLK